jgi:hypothetical protein
MKRPTMTTVKSFIKKNHGNLYLNVKSSFDGMTDGCEYHKNSQFEKVEHTEKHCDNTLGIAGAWFVRGRSGDLLTPFDNGEYVGFDVYNCCGTFIIAVKK